MGAGGDASNGEDTIRILNFNGGLALNPSGYSAAPGFTGGDGSVGTVNDDDKMPNPFDDNSPGGPVSMPDNGDRGTSVSIGEVKIGLR